MDRLLLRIRLAGAALAAGAAAWAAGTIIAGEAVQTRIVHAGTVAGILYLLGVAALAWTVMATGALRSRVIPIVQLVLLAGALVYSFASFGYRFHDDMTGWLVVTDVCWPLANLCTLVMGAAVAGAGRWRGALRWYPLASGCWLVVMIPVKNLLGMGIGVYVSAAWMLGTYAVLGLLLAVRPAAAVPGRGTAAAPVTSGA
ncbi:hypothetical protein [Planomonospora venezuelensis]|uniref:Uncharacterized protein n=1 Tax=Planomonospora venezuelensis TaxID=1999 RepID=A0A841DB58_PLAVE|nr:hypothetical protein [Planomonospora venezuelensis]MBB5964596.1 hypothetical protein [Planomonospora venezuelensis]GIN02894.1 hypothetical protein Pve01_45520 [Planomonospora venezuelensis]